ncbi:MAG: sugar phosphate isomerase/epimerase [Sedimentisphaerales bacterium]|nr:sugar phosphate isomerase/epimerase [Sedimentisphaerales bacterium]
MERRTFLALGGAALGGLCVEGSAFSGQAKREQKASEKKLPFEISLAQWSWHNRLFGRAKPKMDNLDFAEEASKLGITGIEYVNQFFKDKARDTTYLAEMKKRAADNGVQSLLIMCDGEGNLGDPDAQRRTQAVENHYKWVEAAKYLGCHSIRVNAASTGSYEEQIKLAADGLRRLSEYAFGHGLNVIVENHGGLSSNGRWLSHVIKQVNRLNCGTLPDFGNFPPDTDRYEAVEMLMPFAKAVSAKSYDFDDKGDETLIDYPRMMKVVLDAGYKGFVGIEYEGRRLDETEGILATKKLLEKIRVDCMTT